MELIGRQWEQAGVDRFLDRLAAGPAALVLEGEPGIGKTTVWRAALDTARRRDYRVLVCRASESESALSFLGLGDLLERVPDEALERLPEPQRQALRSALLRSAGEGPPDRVSVARGALGVLRASASEAPTVVAIDDAQWLDAPSADVCRFVVHRLTDERLGFLVSMHDGAATALELEQAFPGGELVRLRLESLELDELEEVVRLHLPVSFTPSTWSSLYRVSGGNPFFALQLADALQRRGPQALGEGLPIPQTLADAMRERMTALSAGARSALLPVAALAQPTLALVRAGAAEPEGVDEAVQAGVLQVDGERLRFAHPLLASFVYADVSDADRQAVHARLAPLVTDREEHALHLARGTGEADEAVAAALEATADEAAKRGHPEIAAELAEHAARLTATGHADVKALRLREAARFLYAAGDGHRGRKLLEDLIEQLPPSEERARALSLLGYWTFDYSRAPALLEQALEEAGQDLELRSYILSTICWKEGFAGRWERAASRAREAVALAERSGSRTALAQSLGRLAWSDVGPGRLATIEHAVELERSLIEQLQWGLSPRFVYAFLLFALDRIDDARQQFECLYERAVALGDAYRTIHLSWLAEIELRAGNWQRAQAQARATGEVGHSGIPVSEAWGAASRALVEAHLGNEDVAVRAGEHASGVARADGLQLLLVRSESALGFLRLSSGDVDAALDHLLPLLETHGGIGLWPLHATRTLSSAAEALVAAGDLERAESVVDRLERHARALTAPSAAAAAARCRALRLAQCGEIDAARAAIKDALAAHAHIHEPFELARTYLAQGSIERRAKQKSTARAALGRAEAMFAELDARLWLERTQRELARTGLTRSLGRELTPTELRVAELAAAGSQNKEIASALFISVKSVEANLSRVYAKLGIRSRVELAAGLGRQGPRGSGPAAEP